MLKSDIDKSISTIINTIKDCNIEEMLHTLVEGESKINTVDALKSYKQFIKIYDSYNDFEHKLFEIAGLKDLKHESLWSRFVKPDESDTAEIINELYSSIQFLMNQLPKIQELGNVDEDKIAAVIEAGKNAGVEYVPLSVVVIEEEDLSSPARLSSMLDGIQGLYEVAGRLQNLPVQDLIVTACDSGNDKQFDFLGSSTIIAGVKDIILSFWDRVVFYREDKKGEYIKLLTKSLPVIEVVNTMEKDGELEKEEAEILRRKVIAAVTNLTRAGITIPEMVEHSQHDPRELMRPDRKSLADSVSGADPFSESTEMTGEYPAVVEEDEDEDDDFIEEEAPAATEEETVEETPKDEPAPEPEPEIEPDPIPTPDEDPFAAPKPEPETSEEPAPAEEPEASEPEPAVEEKAEEQVSTTPEEDPFGNLDDAPPEVEKIEDIPSPEPEAAEPAAEKSDSGEDSFDDMDAFGAPPTSSKENAADEDQGGKDYSNLGEDIYTQAGVDDVEVVVEEGSTPPPAVEEQPAESDLQSEVEDEVAEEIVEAPETTEAEDPAEETGIPEVELDDEVAKKMDEEMDNVFERIAAGFLDMKKKEAEEKAKGDQAGGDSEEDEEE